MEKHILLIDDDPDELEIFIDALRSKGMEVTCSPALNAQEAFTFLEGTMPDYIVLDYKMPRINGLECLMDLKAAKHLAHIPVIMYSSVMDEDESKAAMILGAAGCIKKPFDMRTLANLLQPFL